MNSRAVAISALAMSKTALVASVYFLNTSRTVSAALRSLSLSVNFVSSASSDVPASFRYCSIFRVASAVLLSSLLFAAQLSMR